MAERCPKCGSSLAYVFTQWNNKVGELYDLATEEYISEIDVIESRFPIKTYRAVECKKCGTRYLLDDDQYDKYRW